MTDIKELVKRLRERSGQYDEYGWHSEIEIEAADEIERLREENARLREALAPFIDAGHFKVVTEVGTMEQHNQVSIHIREDKLRAARAAIREGGKDV